MSTDFNFNTEKAKKQFKYAAASIERMYSDLIDKDYDLLTIYVVGLLAKKIGHELLMTYKEYKNIDPKKMALMEQVVDFGWEMFKVGRETK